VTNTRVQVIHPPGTYGDDAVYVRVNKELAGAAWPVRGRGIEGGFEDKEAVRKLFSGVSACRSRVGALLA